MSEAETAEMALPVAGVKPGSGSVTTLHVVPFQCSASPPVAPSPTAQALARPRSATPVSPTAEPVMASTDFAAHARPFQCSNSVPKSRGPIMVNPTAHALFAPLALTASSAPNSPRLGVGTSDHALPSQW